MQNHIYWNLELNIKEGKFDQFKSLMDEMVAATKANEPAALNYEWMVNEDKSVCHIFERYADSAATMVHLGNFGAHYAKRFFEVLEPTRFMVYGNPSEDVKAALTANGAQFMEPLGGFSR